MAKSKRKQPMEVESGVLEECSTRLAEHFDSFVLILSHQDESGEWVHSWRERGNPFANIELARQWLERQNTAFSNSLEPSTFKDDEDGDKWKKGK